MKRLITIAILISFLSCKREILDIAPQDRIDDNVVWTDEGLVKAYHTGLYNAIPHGFYLHMYSKYSDEAYNTAPDWSGAGHFARNTYNPDNIGSSSGGDFWAVISITGTAVTSLSARSTFSWRKWPKTSSGSPTRSAWWPKRKC